MANRLDRKNRFFFTTLIAGTIIVTGLMAITFWRVRHPEEPRYLQVKKEQNKTQFRQVQASMGRLLSRESLLLWVQEVVGNVYTFNPVNYQQKFSDMLSTNFTPEGGDSFRQVLNDSQLLKQVLSQQLNVTGIVSGQPVILKQGPFLGVYSWKVQMPVLLTFESASQISTKRIIVTVLIVNIPTIESPLAIGIQQFWSEEY